MPTAFEPYLPAMLPAWAAEDPGLSSRVVQGSLVMFDISGFTRLTERLAARGRAGAEELSDILDAVFGTLVERALAEGCDLLKWGGDAVLLLAEGPDAPVRACRAALRMRAAIGKVGHLRTSVGRVVLRASCGVVTGEVALVLAGDPALHRELMVVGPAATAVATIEGVAIAGQVLVDDTTARTLDPSLVGEQIGPGWLLTGLPRPASAEGPDVGGAGLHRPGLNGDGLDRDMLGQLLPPQLRVHLTRGAHEPEHRVVTAAFLRFEATDGLLERGGLDSLASGVDELVRNAQDATQRHGVSFHESDIDVDGGKIMLVAGAPLSSGDDLDHMLATVRLVIDRATSVPVRAGVAQGRVFTGDLGPPARRTYSVKGAAVNLAARLAAKTSSGQIRLPVELLDRSRLTWQVSDRQALQLKGIAAPVPTAALGVATSSAAGSPDTVMVGRDHELGLLRAALERLGDLEGGSVIVLGEPGMGKTRLVTEVLAEAVDFPVLRADCGHSGASAPYSTVRALLADAFGITGVADPGRGMARIRELVSTLAPELSEQLPLLGAVFDVSVAGGAAGLGSLGEEFRSDAVQRLVVELLRAVQLRPTLMLIEDTHLMDTDSGRVLDQLMARAADRPWLLLTTRRDAPEGWTPAVGERIRLTPLDGGHSDELAGLVSPEHPLPPALAHVLAERAGGHPLFLRELVLAAVRGDRLDDLPLSVEELVVVQIDALAPGPRALLRRAAVLGTTFSHQLLEEVAADSGLATAQQLPHQMEALAAFIVPGGGRKWAFRHTVHREAAYAGLPVKVRARLHARVGDVLARSPQTVARHPEVLAQHYFAGGRFDDAWGYARRAGHKALEQAAPEAAAAAFARAAEAAARATSVPLDEQATDLESWGDASFLCGRSEDAERAYTRARRLQRQAPLRLGDLALKLAKVAHRQARYAIALRRTTTGLREVADLGGDAPLACRARLLARRSIIQMSQGRYTEAARSAQQAGLLATRAGERETVARAHMVLVDVAIFTGVTSEEDHGARALAIFESLGDVAGQAHAQNAIAARLFMKGDWPQALERFERASEMFEKVGDAANAANAAYNSAELLNRQGRAVEAQARLAVAARVAQAVADEELSALVLREQGRADIRSDEQERGMSRLAAARDQLAALHEPHEVCDTDIAMAEAHVLAGRPADGLEVVDRAIQVATRLGAVTLLPSAFRVRASAQVELGDLGGALESLEQGLAAAAQPELAHEHGFLLAVAARLGRPGAAEQAAAALERLGAVRAPLPWQVDQLTGG
jgi:class 3 adenylate cyclase/tetratricopeptide (TPR) repeat protein